jgi:hypothetical protein
VHVQVLVAARRVPIELVRLERTPDLGPYVRVSRELMERFVARLLEVDAAHVDPEDLDLPEVPGFEAHRALVESTLVQTAESRRAAEENRRPPRHRWRREDSAAHTRGWESATRAQMRLAGQDRDTATAALTALVNQMIQLELAADWFQETDARAEAIEESIRWTVFESDVPSRSAQEEWLASWHERSSIVRHFFEAGDQDAVRDTIDLGRDGRRWWSEAWAAWHAAREL